MMSATWKPAVSMRESAEAAARADRRLAWLSLLLICTAFWNIENEWHFTAHDDTLVYDEQLDQYTGSGELFRRLGFLSVGALGCYLLAQREGPRPRFRSLASWCLLATFGCGAASVLWSIDPGTSLRRMIIVALCAVGGLGVARKLDGLGIAWIVVLGGTAFGAIALASELSMGAFRPWQSDHRFSGTTHPNVMGLYLSAACLGILCIRREMPSRAAFWGLFVFVGVLLLLTRSRTSIVAMMGGLTAVWLVGTERTLRMWMGWAFAWLGAAIWLWISFLDRAQWQAVFGVATLGREESVGSLTGRVPLWTLLFEFVEKRPLLGYGYQAFWSRDHYEYLFEELDWAVSHAHNAYVETLLGMGWVGIFLMVASLFFTIQRASRIGRQTKSSGDLFIVALLGYASVHAMFESVFVQPIFTGFLSACGAMHMACYRRAGKESDSQESLRTPHGDVPVIVRPRRRRGRGHDTSDNRGVGDVGGRT